MCLFLCQVLSRFEAVHGADLPVSVGRFQVLCYWLTFRVTVSQGGDTRLVHQPPCFLNFENCISIALWCNVTPKYTFYMCVPITIAQWSQSYKNIIKQVAPTRNVCQFCDEKFCCAIATAQWSPLVFLPSAFGSCTLDPGSPVPVDRGVPSHHFPRPWGVWGNINSDCPETQALVFNNRIFCKFALQRSFPVIFKAECELRWPEINFIENSRLFYAKSAFPDLKKAASFFLFGFWRLILVQSVAVFFYVNNCFGMFLCLFPWKTLTHGFFQNVKVVKMAGLGFCLGDL